MYRLQGKEWNATYSRNSFVLLLKIFDGRFCNLLYCIYLKTREKKIGLRKREAFNDRGIGRLRVENEATCKAFQTKIKFVCI